MTMIVCATIAIDLFAAELLKQWIAERIGDVDERGERRRIALQIGAMVRAVDRTAAAPRVPDESTEPPDLRDPASLAARALLAFWMGGGFAVIGWRRERAALLALLREQALAQAQAARRFPG